MYPELPRYMPPPPEPQPRRGGQWFPHIIRHDVQDDGTVLVTWALPGLASAVVRVPFGEWMEGQHSPTGAFLASFVLPLLANTPQTPYRPSDQDDG